jgi:hypothetical protein
VPQLKVRWSEHEARKEYARPFGVGFLDDNGDQITAIAVNGRELLFYRDFQEAVLSLLGEIFLHPDVEGSEQPQIAWLDVVSGLIPSLDEVRFQAVSTFAHDTGRIVHFDAVAGETKLASIPAPALLEYQHTQHMIAHQCGRLLRVEALEAVADNSKRQRVWLAWLRERTLPVEEEYAVAQWPWK